MRRLSKLFTASALVVALLAVFSQGVAFASGGPKQPSHQTGQPSPKTVSPLTTPWPAQHYSLNWVTSISQAGASVQQYCFNAATGTDDQYVAYIGTDNDQIHIFDASYNIDYGTGQHSPANPGISCFQDQLWIDWSGGNYALEVGHWEQTDIDAGELTGIMQVPGQTTDGGTPAMTVGGSNWSTLYVGWVANNTGRYLYIEQSSNGTSWTNMHSFGDTTHRYAGFTLYGDNYGSHQVYASWVSSTSTPTINLALYQGSSTWAWKHTFTSDWSPYAPGIEVYNGKVYFIWTGGSTQNTISNIYTGCWTGSWHGNIRQSDTTSQSVSMDGDGTNLVTAFTATDNSVVYTQNWYSYPAGC